ncbi:MAG TPA: hypothetical protein VIN09_14130, partial [Chloroflexota bacterium]
VAPPSVHRSGKPYTWDLPGDVDPAPFAELPRWLVELAGRGEPPRGGHERLDVAAVLAGVPEGQ